MTTENPDQYNPANLDEHPVRDLGGGEWLYKDATDPDRYIIGPAPEQPPMPEPPPPVPPKT
jgi:hypothetical protein